MIIQVSGAKQYQILHFNEKIQSLAQTSVKVKD
jgi:hypothetical protein